MEDDELTPHLQCDVELQITATSGEMLNKSAAQALRKAAAMVESGQLEDGFIDLRDDAGKKVGTIYVDYSEGNLFSLETPN